MAYEPKTWVCGETITADGLNNIEEGVQEALEGSGGVEVSKIKLGTATGGLIPLTSLVYAFDSGFTISDGKSVGDLIGDKKLINIAFDGRAENIGAFPLVGQAFSNTDGNFLTMDDSVLKAQRGLNVSGVARTGSGTPTTATVDVYAICI